MVQTISALGLPEGQPKTWHSLEIVEAIADLETDLETGLNSVQIKQRLAEFGANELTAKKSKPWWWKFLLQFNQPL
ncbi:cation-transporting P-type ATPase, partial [Fischerella thermalis]